MEVNILQSTPDAEELVVQAARNDYSTEYIADKSFDEILGESASDDKEEFLTRLLERGHFGPFEHPQVTVAIKGVSRTCMAQLTRHRHATFDVQSLRYTAPGKDEEIHRQNIEKYVVIPKSFSPAIEPDDNAQMVPYIDGCVEQFRRYQEFLTNGIPKEDARFILPLATKVNMVMSVNARALLHVLDMRFAGDAQWEIQELAENILNSFEDWMPITAQYYNQNMNPRKNRLSP